MALVFHTEISFDIGSGDCRQKCAKQHHMHQSKNVYIVLVQVLIQDIFLRIEVLLIVVHTFAFLAEQFHLFLWVR